MKVRKKGTKADTKVYLTLEEVFETSSEYFLKMMQIIQKNSKYPKIISKGRELHHIIERNFSKLKKKDIDNREDNLVSLTKNEHVLVHFYAWKCVKQEFKRGAARAITIMRRNLICGDVAKNEFIINLLAESNELINNDANFRELMYKGHKTMKKTRRSSVTLDILDALTAEIMCNVSRGRTVQELYQKLGLIGKNHCFKQRYVYNGMKEVYKEMPNLRVEPLIGIIRSIFGNICKTWRRTGDELKNNCILYSFITWYLSEYHCDNKLYNEKDTIKDIIEKYNNDILCIQYEQYLTELEKYVDKSGTWYNDGIVERRFKINPDISYWKTGRLRNEELMDEINK